MAIVHVTTQEEYDKEVKNSDVPVMLDFWAPWCGPCKMLSPIFEKVAEEVENVKFVKINIDEADELAEQFGIRSVPTIALVKDGEVIEQKAGIMPKGELIELAESAKE